jgi:uncharacterized protein (TIGR02284 family)
MTNTDAVVHSLGRLARINVASAKGFNVTAENVKNRGLKVLLKSFAQERAQFAADLRNEMEKLKPGSSTKETLSLSQMLGSLHRGWINIKSAMTIGQPSTERVVLSEVQRGEAVARGRYGDVLEKGLPEPVRQMVLQQFEEIQGDGQRIDKLAGEGQHRTVVRLFDTEAAARQAVNALEEAGFDDATIEHVTLQDVARVFIGEDSNLRRESMIAGALLAAIIVTVLAIIASVLTELLSTQSLPQIVGLSLGEIILLALVLGAAFGGLFGAVIGVGITEEDAHRYADSLMRGNILLFVETTADKADQASAILKRVNAGRFAMAS